jgi:hypothetical protein
MKIHSVKLVLDKDYFEPGEKVTGKLQVKSHDQNWGNEGKVFIKFYDKLNIEWVEEEITIEDPNRVYTNFSRPFQIDYEVLFDKTKVVQEAKEDDDFVFSYPIDFQLLDNLQGTQTLRNAKCQYFIKAYLTHDELAAKNYINGVNVFDQFFKSLNHTYIKQEVVVRLLLMHISPNLSDKHTFEAKSGFIKVIVTLPKLIYHRNETVELHLKIENESKSVEKLSLHKIGFKLFQVLKLTSKQPVERIRLFEYLINHSNRKNVHQNTADGIILEEFIQIPKDLPSSSSRSDVTRAKQNPIRVNYKISLQFWKSLFFDELDVNIPILVDPEA